MITAEMSQKLAKVAQTLDYETRKKLADEATAAKSDDEVAHWLTIHTQQEQRAREALRSMGSSLRPRKT